MHKQTNNLDMENNISMESSSQKRPLVDFSEEAEIIKEVYSYELIKFLALSLICLIVFVSSLFIIDWSIPLTYMITFIFGVWSILFSITWAVMYSRSKKFVKIFMYQNNEIIWAFLENVHVTRTVYGITVDKSEFYKLIIYTINGKRYALNLKDRSVDVIKSMSVKLPEIEYGYQ